LSGLTQIQLNPRIVHFHTLDLSSQKDKKKQVEDLLFRPSRTQTASTRPPSRTTKCLHSPEFAFHVPVFPTPARQLDSSEIPNAERANTRSSNRTIRDTNRISQDSFKGTAKCREKVKDLAVNGDLILLLDHEWDARDPAVRETDG
jgi:hypothetical protein